MSFSGRTGSSRRQLELVDVDLLFHQIGHLALLIRISTRSIAAGFFASGRTIVRIAALVGRLRALDVDVGGEGDLAREAAVVDLHLLVDASGAPRAPPLSRDEERALVGVDLNLGRIDARQLGDDVDRPLGSVAVDLRAEAAVPASEARHLPEVGEELFHFAADAIDGVTRHGPMVATRTHLTHVASRH